MKWQHKFCKPEEVDEYLDQLVADRWYVSTNQAFETRAGVMIYVASCQRPAKAKSSRWAKKKDSE